MTSTRDPGCVPDDPRARERPLPAGGAGSVQVECLPALTRIRLGGEIDIELAPALAGAVETARTAGVPVTVDASAVTFMDSTGVAFLARLAARAEPRVVLERPTAVVRFLLDVTAVSTLLDVQDDAAEADAAEAEVPGPA